MVVNKENESSQVASASVIVCCRWKGVILFPSHLAHALHSHCASWAACQI